MFLLNFAVDSACLRSSPPIFPTTCPLSHNTTTGNVCSQYSIFERASSCPIIYPSVTSPLSSADTCTCHDAQCARASDAQLCARPQHLCSDACGCDSQREQARALCQPVVHACSDRSKTACSKEGGSHCEGFAPFSSSSLDPSSLWQGWQRRYGSLQVRGRRCGSARHTPSASAPPPRRRRRRRQRWRRLL